MSQTADEILRALQNGGDTGEGGEGKVEANESDENSVIRGLRDQIKEKNAQLKTLGEEVGTLREFKTTVESERKTATVTDVFKGLGMDEDKAKAQSTLFLKVHEGDVTPEAVKQFLVDYKLVESIEGVQTSEQNAQGFTPANTGGSSSGSQIMSAEDANALKKSNPASYLQAVRDGRVPLLTELPTN